MQIHLGPLPSGAVVAWTDYARAALARAQDGDPAAGAALLPPEAVAAFEGFLDRWEQAVRPGIDFVWVGEIDMEQLEFLTHTWFVLAEKLAAEAEARGYPLAPAEGEPFYQALVAAVLEGLSQEGRSTAEFSEQLRDLWPGLKEP